MAKPLLVDSDVMVDFLRGHPKAVAFVNAHVERILIPAVVAAELYAGVKEGAEQTILDDLMDVFRVVDLTPAIARAGGLLRRDYGRSHRVGLVDAILAATAQAEGAELITLNVRHYPMFKDLKGAYEKR
jgi:predicted nucleic acid-binding protein